MTFRHALRSTAREWFVACLCYALLVAPFGCEINQQVLDNLDNLDNLFTGGDPSATSDTGLFINDDVSQPLIAAGKAATGAGFFVFGKRAADGAVLEIDAITARDSGGQDAFISFELGRPMHVQGLDGSYAHVTYNEVGNLRLNATVDLWNASSGASEQHVIEVDLNRAAEEVAALVQQVTGRTVPVTDPDTLTAKGLDRASAVAIFSPIFALVVLPIVLLVNFSTVILGQLLTSLFAILGGTLQIILMSIFFPFFLISELVNGLAFNVRVSEPLTLKFDFLPSPPLVTLRL